MSLTSKASLLAIGTEITSGEINNTNVKWFAERLEELGFEVVLHMAVPDDRPSMINALNYSEAQAEILIVTGGLGPTSDDFTREVVAKWAGDSLEFRQEAWDFLEDISKQRGLKLREAHKQQCQFPSQSETLKNRIGTAHGFYLKKGALHCFVLPGPPKEIEAMWERSVLPRLEALRPATSPRLHRWTCTGVPESEVAELVEECLKDSGCKIGYRASKPNVHVKVWVPADVNADEYLKKLDAILKPFKP